MLTWRDGVVAFGWLALFHAANIVVLTVCVLLAHGATCCWEPLGWILSGIRSAT